jgi:predicted GIY-YIG superfamily endonuclease
MTGKLFTLKIYNTKEEVTKRELQIKSWKSRIKIEKLIQENKNSIV